MADISITAGGVIPVAGTEQLIYGVAGETITAGMIVYLKSTDNEYYKADCTTSATTAAAVGMAMNGASNGQRLTIQTGGDVTMDGLSLSAAVGSVIVLSAAGAICPSGDIADDDYLTLIGVAMSTTRLRLAIKSTGVQSTA